MRTRAEIIETGPDNFDEAIALRDCWFQFASNAAMATNRAELAGWLQALHRVETWLPSIQVLVAGEVRRVMRTCDPIHLDAETWRKVP